MNRSVAGIVTAHRQTKGAGFIVRRPLPTAGMPLVDPFLHVDEMGPIDCAPGETVGAPDHPQRGFETVSYLLEGEVHHEDSAGHAGVIRAGDVQWMTAGRGIINSETPTVTQLDEGARVHGFQLWVNLPARGKMMAPRYQKVPSHALPTARSADGLASMKVIAGDALGRRAVIDTRTPTHHLDSTLEAGATVEQAIPERHNALVYVFEGEALVSGHAVTEGQLALLDEGDRVARRPAARRAGGRSRAVRHERRGAAPRGHAQLPGGRFAEIQR